MLNRIQPRIPRMVWGFSLLEVVIVVMIIGILTTTGITYFHGATSDARIRTLTDAAQAFLYACRDRAAARGIPVRLHESPGFLQAVNSPQLRLAKQGLTAKTIAQISQLTFAGRSITNGQGTIIHGIPISFDLPGKPPVTVHILLQTK